MHAHPLSLFPLQTRTLPASLSDHDSVRAIEDSSFPFELLSDIAEVESWRKEIHRPVYHIHKWWARRLGSVFRAIILGAFAPTGSNLLELFYSPARLPADTVVFDPFMGSGTTVGEALKMGARAIGFDVNPVAHFLVRNALGMPSRHEIVDTFRAVQRDVASRIQRYYETRLADARKAHVLYYFWVKQAFCPRCHHAVDLFSSYVFADHAYRKRHPDAHAVCPGCGAVNVIRFDARRMRCTACHGSYDPQRGPAHGTKATCPRCQETFPIARAAREQGTPPPHRLYAKLVLLPGGEKDYFAADAFDLALYAKAERDLAKCAEAYPIVKITPGYNTNQALNYSYTHWHQMFNARQLLCLSILAERLKAIPDARLRRLFCCLFSGVLEFNNMFTSYKGEGTGAVRHMFYHHILKPEREPLEANVWGMPKSSGAFSTLFERRILRALDYCETPSELRLTKRSGRLVSTRVLGLSVPLFHDAATNFADFAAGQTLYLARCDSARTDLPDASVDAVITDPPFFDNVHYSQLADFFYVWQRHILGEQGYYASETTRSDADVQHEDSAIFTDRLTKVWRECYRVLKPTGLLVFTYHHSRAEGWRSVLASLHEAGFLVVRAHPIKSEMSVATPKHQAREPIDLDMILVCRKPPGGVTQTISAEPEALASDAYAEARGQLMRLRTVGRKVSRNDVRVVLTAQVLVRLSSSSTALSDFDRVETVVGEMIDRLYGEVTSRRCLVAADASPKGPRAARKRGRPR
jgi:adenine-specific DNA methylase